MEMRQTLEFDCRTICDGKRCPHLHPGQDLRLAMSVKMFICRDKNLIIMAEITNVGKPNEEILSVNPIQDCVQMRKLHSKGLAQWAEFSIGTDGTGTQWNPPIKPF
jgi:hypothetical protein